MNDQRILNVPVVLADRVYMSQKALNEIALLGGCIVADAVDSGDLAEKIGGASSVKVIVSEYVPLDDAVLRQAPALKGVIAYGAGYDHIDLEAMKRRGVKVCNCRGRNAQAVAELTFSLLLCLLRKIHKVDPWVRAGKWEEVGRALPGWFSGEELSRKTLGVIGLGQIGGRVARIAKGFDMRVIGYNPSTDLDHYGRLGVEPAALAELISISDVVSLHLPLTPDTESMIDSKMLARAKPGMIIVNTSRGKVLDQGALVDALKAGRLGGAALDVFSDEPLRSGNPLAAMDNVVLSPHIGAMTREAGDRLSDAVSRQAGDILEGRSPEYLIC
jgi:phosphoglycerate dehydrogenase-like enzyme